MDAFEKKIQALIDYANETTGAGDTLLGDAVHTLVEGYGGGPSDEWTYLMQDAIKGDGGADWIETIPTNITPNTVWEMSLDVSGISPQVATRDWPQIMNIASLLSVDNVLAGGRWENLYLFYERESDSIKFRSTQNTPEEARVSMSSIGGTLVVRFEDAKIYANDVKVADCLYFRNWSIGNGLAIGAVGAECIPIKINYIRKKEKAADIPSGNLPYVKSNGANYFNIGGVFNSDWTLTRINGAIEHQNAPLNGYGAGICGCFAADNYRVTAKGFRGYFLGQSAVGSSPLSMVTGDDDIDMVVAPLALIVNGALVVGRQWNRMGEDWYVLGYRDSWDTPRLERGAIFRYLEVYYHKQLAHRYVPYLKNGSVILLDEITGQEYTAQGDGAGFTEYGNLQTIS